MMKRTLNPDRDRPIPSAFKPRWNCGSRCVPTRLYHRRSRHSEPRIQALLPAISPTAEN
ncbi:MAG: hypothetical protein SW833_28595 [Cyanobacteriota bacterium]|nr:hypothetical protein [Cyanobacteriota bacterium]